MGAFGVKNETFMLMYSTWNHVVVCCVFGSVWTVLAVAAIQPRDVRLGECGKHFGRQR